MTGATSLNYLTIEEANELLEDLKFWPFGTAFEGTFVIEPDQPDLLLMRRMGYDSRAWQFGGSDEDDGDLYDDNTQLENLHRQEFSLNLRPEDFAGADALYQRAAFLVAYSMAHKGLEWFRHADGSLVHDPHVAGDVQVVMP